MAFMKAGEYCAQFDAPADGHYDGSGIGRIQRRGAPPPLALSVPFAKKPSYGLDVTNKTTLAIMPGWLRDGKWMYSYEGLYKNLTASAANGKAKMDVEVVREASPLRLSCEVSADGVEIVLVGDGELALVLPVFEFDGERKTAVHAAEKTVDVSLDGWTCRYEANGAIVDTGSVYGNRNGHYRRYEARGRGRLAVKVALAPLSR